MMKIVLNLISIAASAFLFLLQHFNEYNPRFVIPLTLIVGISLAMLFYFKDKGFLAKASHALIIFVSIIMLSIPLIGDLLFNETQPFAQILIILINFISLFTDLSHKEKKDK